MYKIDYKNVRKAALVFYLFAGIGVLFLILMATLIINQVKTKNMMDSSVIANEIEIYQTTNSDGDYLYGARYHYTVDNVDYVCNSSYTSSSSTGFKSSDVVLYQADNPSNSMAEASSNISTVLLLFAIIPLVITGVGIMGVINNTKKVKKLKWLANNGTLFRNLDYTLVNSNLTVNGVTKKAFRIDTTLPNGRIVDLVSGPIFSNNLSDADGYVDLLIDENDYSNFYIDLNIE